MKPPSATDRVVKVRAYLTDEAFGYEYWRASQFCSPEDAQPAVLVICATKEEQERLLRILIGPAEALR